MREDAEQRRRDLRELFNGLRYVIRYGIAWCAMPNDLPLWSAVYLQSRRWMEASCFEALTSELRAVLRMASGRKAEPTAAILDRGVRLASLRHSALVNQSHMRVHNTL